MAEAGWYDNPEGSGERYWNGNAWTDDYQQPEPPWWKTPAIIVGVFLAIVLLVMVAGDGEPERADRPGVDSVYQRIETTRDCAELQETFDRAASNVDRYEPGDKRRKAPMSYMDAADERMRAVGCYD